MREKRNRAQDKNEPLFDYNLDCVDPNEPLIVEFEGLSDDQIETFTAAFQRDSDLENVQNFLNRADAKTPKPAKPISKLDPLKPDSFIGHHRRMEREERRMQVQERQNLMTTALRLKAQKELLIGPDWKRYIEKIIRINDFSNLEEIKRKRELAIADITAFLSKFDDYHRRLNRRDSRKDQSNSKPKKPANKDSILKPASKLASKLSAASKTPDLPTYEPPQELLISLRPCAFGFMIPPRVFPPKDFALPQLLKTEVETYDLIDELSAKRPKHI